MSQVFDTAAIMKARRPLSLWTKFRLLFCKTYKVVDVDKNLTYTMWFKRLDGMTYMVGDWTELTTKQEGRK